MVKKTKPAAQRKSTLSVPVKPLEVAPLENPFYTTIPSAGEDGLTIDNGAAVSKLPKRDDFSMFVPALAAGSEEVISIQVTPFTIDIHDEVHVQPDGPSVNTEGWAVYARLRSSKVVWIADTAHDKHAEFIGHAFAKLHAVGIESYPWLKA
jgi:hypothetical protein